MEKEQHATVTRLSLNCQPHAHTLTANTKFASTREKVCVQLNKVEKKTNVSFAVWTTGD